MLHRSHVVALALIAACKTPDVTFRPPSEDAQHIDDAASPQAISCRNLTATCGDSSADSCCRSLEVPGGSYYRSYDVAGDVDSGAKSDPATVSNFRLDKYEVTVERFRAFVNAGMGTQANPPAPGAGAHPNIAESGWKAAWNANLVMDTTTLVASLECDSTFHNHTWTTDTQAGNEHRPMDCLTWYEAMAFCAWDGGYLPTEAEWNYAATGGDQQRAYPWSNPAESLTIDGSHASYDPGNGADCIGDGMPGCTVADLAYVGTKPAGEGRWGQSGLAGNVAEWVLDSQVTYANPCTDCADLTAAADRGVRGGGFDVDSIALRTSNRSHNAPMNRDVDLGVRCARSP